MNVRTSEVRTQSHQSMHSKSPFCSSSFLLYKFGLMRPFVSLSIQCLVSPRSLASVIELLNGLEFWSSVFFSFLLRIGKCSPWRFYWWFQNACLTPFPSVARNWECRFLFLGYSPHEISCGIHSLHNVLKTNSRGLESFCSLNVRFWFIKWNGF